MNSTSQPHNHALLSWLCSTGIISPWSFVIWIVPVLISVRYRFGLQRKVLGRVRVDMLLGTGVMITLIPAAVYGVAMSIRDYDSSSIFTAWDLVSLVFSLVFIVFLSLFVALPVLISLIQST